MKWAKSFIGAGIILFLYSVVGEYVFLQSTPATMGLGIGGTLIGIYLYYKAKKKEREENESI